jgi:LysR family cyn operon transcriptional activator
MNFRQLCTLVAIVESGGIHRAAARLNLSQPAASRQIHALEAELGVPLFDPVGRRLHSCWTWIQSTILRRLP